MKSANGNEIEAKIATDHELRSLKGIIYLFFNRDNGKVYIGQYSGTFYERYNVSPDKWFAKAKNDHFKNALKRLKGENFIIFLLRNSIKSSEERNDIEVKFIKSYQSSDRKFGYNKTSGGKASLFSQETRENFLKKSRARKNEFIERSRKIHGDKYSYEEIEFDGISSLVKNIKCRACGKHLSQTGFTHLSGRGCLDCSYKERGKNRKVDYKAFVNRAKKRWGSEYSYDEKTYTGVANDVNITHVRCGTKFKRRGIYHIKYGSSITQCPLCTKNCGKKTPIVQIDKITNKVVKTYESRSQAERDLGVSIGAFINKEKCWNGFWFKKQ